LILTAVAILAGSLDPLVKTRVGGMTAVQRCVDVFQNDLA
jgi:hypothetical protein